MWVIKAYWTRGIIAHWGNRSVWTLRSISVENIHISVQWEENLILCFDGAQLMRYRAKPLNRGGFKPLHFFGDEVAQKSYHNTQYTPSPHPPPSVLPVIRCKQPRQAVGLNGDDGRPASSSRLIVPISPRENNETTSYTAGRAAAARSGSGDPHVNGDDYAAPCFPSSALHLPHERWSRWWTLDAILLHLPSLIWASDCSQKGRVNESD